MAKFSDEVQLKLKNLPTDPGVYMFRNASGKIIYIGKAKNLRNRVRTYFRKSTRFDPKTEKLVSNLADFELLVTENELESLILEANLIKEHKPRYNVNLKDDKHFPYIKITDEPFPRVLVVRRLERDKARYFGPYTSARRMRRTYELLTRLFRIRTCNYQLPAPEGKEYKVCLDYHIKRCDAPCVGFQTQEEYAAQVKAVVLVLSGHSRQLLRELDGKMKVASAAMKFEEAKEARDQIEAIKSMMGSQNADVGELVDRDIVVTAREGRDAVGVVMQVREGALIGRQDFQLSAHMEEPDISILESFVTQYYNRQPNLPDEVCLNSDLADAPLMQKWLTGLRKSKVRLLIPKKGSRLRLVDLAGANARLLLDEFLIQKRTQTERTSKMVSALKDELHLQFAPRTIVCFDISNTGDMDAVGSLAYFENGKPKKSMYRHFRIKGVTGQDDFTMMREVIGRYFHRVKEEGQTPPSLVVVDGGKGQLSAALAELKSLGSGDQSIISLAKRLEEVYLPGRSDPITIPRSSPALMLLKRVRDEAHRFAVGYNRKVRQKRTIKSELDEIAGVGPSRRKALLAKFGSVKKIAEASVDELAAVKGISGELAEKVKGHFAAK